MTEKTRFIEEQCEIIRQESKRPSEQLGTSCDRLSSHFQAEYFDDHKDVSWASINQERLRCLTELGLRDALVEAFESVDPSNRDIIASVVTLLGYLVWECMFDIIQRIEVLRDSLDAKCKEYCSEPVARKVVDVAASHQDAPEILIPAFRAMGDPVRFMLSDTPSIRLMALNALEKFSQNPSVCAEAMQLMGTTINLTRPDDVKTIMDNDGIKLIANAMKTHDRNELVMLFGARVLFYIVQKALGGEEARDKIREEGLYDFIRTTGMENLYKNMNKAIEARAQMFLDEYNKQDL